MIYKGYKIRVRCLDWEQINIIDQYWDYFRKYVESEKLVALGMNWTKDYLYFDYALGVIDDEETFGKLKTIDFSNTDFQVEYIEVSLPDENEWKTFTGKDEDVQSIYEEQIDGTHNPYDYELEYIDRFGNIEIKIHFIKK